MVKHYSLNREASAKLREDFHDPIREYAANLDDKQRHEFQERVQLALNKAADYDRYSTISRGQQIRETELRLYQSYHRQVEVSELTDTPAPPRPTHQEIVDQARDTVDARVATGRARVDSEIREDLNALCDRLTNKPEVFGEKWKASAQIEKLDSYLQQLQHASVEQEAEMEQEL